VPYVVCDVNEPSEILEMIRDEGIVVERRDLPVSDYMIPPNIGVERKTVSDFWRSIRDGRLFDQLTRLCESFPIPILIVEGGAEEVREVFWFNPRIFWGAVATTIVSSPLRIVFTGSMSDTAILLASLARKARKVRRHEERAVRPRLKGRKLTDEDHQLLVLQGLPMVGLQRARKLLRRFGTLREVFSASEADLRRVLGDAVGRRVYGIIVKRYRGRSREEGAFKKLG